MTRTFAFFANDTRDLKLPQLIADFMSTYICTRCWI